MVDRTVPDHPAPDPDRTAGVGRLLPGQTGTFPMPDRFYAAGPPEPADYHDGDGLAYELTGEEAFESLANDFGTRRVVSLRSVWVLPRPLDGPGAVSVEELEIVGVDVPGRTVTVRRLPDTPYGRAQRARARGRGGRDA